MASNVYPFPTASAKPEEEEYSPFLEAVYRSGMKLSKERLLKLAAKHKDDSMGKLFLAMAEEKEQQNG